MKCQDHQKKERKTIQLSNEEQVLTVKKVKTSTLSKVLLRDVYVISDAQYNALQSGFKEMKDYMYETKETKNEFEAGKEIMEHIKQYQEHSQFYAVTYQSKQALQFAGPILFVGFFYWNCILCLCR